MIAVTEQELTRNFFIEGTRYRLRASAPTLHRVANRDDREPSSHGRVITQVTETLHRVEKNFLHHVIDVVAIAQHAVRSRGNVTRVFTKCRVDLRRSQRQNAGACCPGVAL